MIIIRNNLLCNHRDHLDLERYIRNQESKGTVLLLPDYCEVLGVGKGSPEIVLVDHEYKQIEVQKHGYWIVCGSGFEWQSKCSSCGAFQRTKLLPYNFCPSCGAKMDLADNITGSPDPADPV